MALASAGATRPPGVLLPGALISVKHSGLGGVSSIAGATICGRTAVQSDLVYDKSQCCGSTLFATKIDFKLQQFPRSFVIPAPGSYPDGSFCESP